MQTQRHTEICIDQGINRDQKLIVTPTEKIDGAHMKRPTYTGTENDT